MKLGIGTYTYTWAIGAPGYPPPQPMDGFALLRRAAALGVRVVQFADNLPLHALPPVRLDALADEAEALGIEVEVGTRGIAPDHLCVYLDIARRFGSPILRVVIDTAAHHPPLTEVIETLRAVMPAFAAAGVTLAIENHDRFSAREFVEIVTRVGGPHIGICLDTVNSFGALEGPEVVVKALGPYVANLHLKDFSIRRAPHMMGFVVEGTPAGQGRLDVPWLLECLHRYGRDCNAILELWPPPEATVEDTILKEEAWAAASVAYLRTLIPG